LEIADKTALFVPVEAVDEFLRPVFCHSGYEKFKDNEQVQKTDPYHANC